MSLSSSLFPISVRAAGIAAPPAAAAAMAAACASLLLSACGSLEKPVLPTALPAGWSGVAEPPSAFAPAASGRVVAPDLQGWWKVLGDPRLDALVDRALTQNLTLAQARARLRAARRLADGEGARYLPTLSGELRTVQDVAAVDNYFRAGLDATWELGLFGLRPAVDQAAQARVDEAAAYVQAARVSVVAELVRHYLLLRAAQRDLALQQRMVALDERLLTLQAARARQRLGSLAQRHSLELRRVQTEAGGAASRQAAAAAAQAIAVLLAETAPAAAWADFTGADFTGADAARPETVRPDSTRTDSTRTDSTGADSTRAETARADAARAETARADSTLADSTRADAVQAKATRADSDQADATQADSARADGDAGATTLGAPGALRIQIEQVPADLLRFRPDVRLAEAEVERASGDLGVARAALYPRVTLGLSYIYAYNITQNRRNVASTLPAIGPAIDIPLFDWGRRRAEADAGEATLQAALLGYRQALLEAFGETETALSGLARARERVDRAAEAERLVERESARQATRQRLGLGDAALRLDAERELLQASADRSAATSAWTLSFVQLYKSLGGAPFSDAAAARPPPIELDPVTSAAKPVVAPP